MLTFEITIGKGDAQQTRVIQFDPEDITLGFLEDMDILQDPDAKGKNATLRRAVADLLGLTVEESRALTVKQFNQLGAALKAAGEAQALPNG